MRGPKLGVRTKDGRERTPPESMAMGTVAAELCKLTRENIPYNACSAEYPLVLSQKGPSVFSTVKPVFDILQPDKFVLSDCSLEGRVKGMF